MPLFKLVLLSNQLSGFANDLMHWTMKHMQQFLGLTILDTKIVYNIMWCNMSCAQQGYESYRTHNTFIQRLCIVYAYSDLLQS